jgi:hypothetical protein
MGLGTDLLTARVGDKDADYGQLWQYRVWAFSLLQEAYDLDVRADRVRRRIHQSQTLCERSQRLLRDSWALRQLAAGEEETEENKRLKKRRG